MSVKDKYSKLISYAQSANIQNLTVREENNVLSVKGRATQAVKQNLWNFYQQIDPDMRGGDLILDIEVIPGSEEVYEVKAGDSLSKIATKYPGMTWKKILDANKDQIKDPDKIFPGQKIKIPL